MQYYRPDDEVVPGHFLVRFLGRGGFGEVWKATGPGGVELAIKIINLGSDQGFKEFRAVRLLRKLRHPNLVPLFGFWLKDDRGFLIGDNAADSPTRIAGAAAEMVIAMGLCEKSLLERLKECKKAGVKGIPTVELLDYMEDAGRAIDYLNEPCHDLGQGPVGIQHCDIKPANLLIVGNAAQVCDFGLARVLGDQARSSTAGAMSPAYVAPEIIENKPCRQTDQYSLAITYYELRTGELPFNASDPSTAMRAHQSGNLDFSAVPPAEQRVVKRAASLDPGQRYPSTLEMVQELRRAATEIRPTSRGDIYIGGPVQPNQELVPGHRLVRKIGQGGYGEVWEGVAPGGIRCAFKIITSLEASQNVQEFRVLEMMKGLEHDHLMSLQAYWLLDGEGKVLPEGPEAEATRASATMLVIQTQLAAKNLSQRLKECQGIGWPGIPPHELLPYIRQAASAIDYLNAPQHHLGERVLSIQHRDIKPENILLSRQGSVKVTDFGLAKMVEGTCATIHSKSRGLTAAYAAPEMFKGLVTRSTDQYSLAITYYRLRTGKLPFDQNQPLFSMMLVHTEGRLDFGLLSLAEQEVLQRATKVNPDDRFPSCLDMIAALEGALGVRSENTTASISVSTSGPPPTTDGEPTRVVPSVPFSGDKGHPTAGRSRSDRTSAPPAPGGAPAGAGRADVPPTLPPTQNPLAARAAPAAQPPLAPTLKKGAANTPHVPPTLPPTQHTSGQRARPPSQPSPAAGGGQGGGAPAPAAAPPPAAPPPVTEPGLGKPTQLVPIGEFDFSSSEDPLVLPGQTGSTKVTVTRIKEPKQKASSTTPPDLEEEELAPHLIKTSLPPEEVAVAGDDIREAPEEKKEQVVAVRSRRPWRLVEIVVGSILATVLGYLVVYLLWFRSPPDPPDDPGRTVDLVQTRIRDKEFEAALRELNEATLDEKTKNQERAKVVKAWLDDLGPKGPRTQVEGLRNLLNYVKDHEEANQRYRAALALYLPARAEELSEAGDSPGALDLLKTFDPQGQPKAVQEKIALTEKRVLSAWVGRARTHRTDKDFNKANKVLSAILQKRPGNVEAIAVQKDVANDIAEVSRERDVLIAAGQFPMALKYVADAWPNGGKELSTPIFDGWLAWAKARKDSDPAAAEAALDQLLSRDAGNSAAESLRTQVRKQLVTSAILTLIAENKTASCRDAARKLYGPDGKKLGDAERDRLGEQIAKAWLDLVNKEKIPRLRKDLLIALTNEIPDSIPSSKTAKKLVGEIPDIEGDKVVRDAVQDLLKERFAASRTALQRARREVGTSDKDLVARVDALLPVVDLAERATADPLKGDLEGLEKALSDSRITDGDRSNLKGLAGRLFDRRIRLRVQALPKDVNWSQLLADCKKVEEAPSAWVLACRVECLVELGKANGKEWAKARSELEKFKAEPEAVAYAAYVLALADWQANDYPSAANRLLQLFEDDKPVPAVLQDVPARRTKAVQFFLSAAGVLRGRGQLTQPFGTARDASEAFGWLKQARRLAGGTASVPLRANLALAAWYKMPRNSDLAKDLSDTLKDKATLKEALLDADVYRVLLIHAATRDNTAAGRKDALEGYLAALDCVREFLKTRAEPQVAEHFYGEVVKWARADDGKALLGEGPDDEVKGRYARLCGGIARLFKDFAPSWYKLTKPAGGPIQQAKDLYHLAYRNATTDADRAEFLAFKGFMSNELPSPKVGQLKEFAVEAQKLAPPYAGGFGLEGSALILEERGKTDLADRRRLLTEADGKLDKALELVKALKPEDRQRELKALLLRTKGVLHVELANYHSVADRKKREGSLQAAQQAIEQALALDDRSLEARDTLGCILEDYGWLLGKTDQFDEACKEFKKAMEPGSLETGRTSPWLGRGRTRFKWAEALMVSQGPDDKTVKGLLDESFSDLGEVVDHPRNPIQVAEALYWQGRIHTLRNKTQDAQEAFKRSVELARQENSEGWQEAAAQGWADVAAREVLARYQEPGYNLASNLQEALKRCDELEKFSKPRAASFRVGLIRLAIYRTKEKPEALLKVFEDGLEPGGRTQDEFFRVHLLVQRSDVYLKGREVKRDLAKAHADATAALKLSETAVVDAGTRAYALGVIGLARQAQAPSADEKTKEEYREEALESLRKALDLSPKHFAAWEWKAYVSGLLILKLPKKVKDDGPTRTEVTLAEEACRYYLEAEQDLPEVERKGGGYDWLADNSQPNLKEKAVPILRKALEKFAFDADVWKWHRGIAAVLAEEKDDLKLEARASLRKAVEGARNPDDLKRLQKLQGKIN